MTRRLNALVDSSRRAVEAADNVVHAYDMNMNVPATPESRQEDNEVAEEEFSGRRGRLLLNQVGHDEAAQRRPSSNKRRRSSSTDRTTRRLRKYRAIELSPDAPMAQSDPASLDQSDGFERASNQIVESARFQLGDELTPRLSMNRPTSPNPKRTRLKRTLRSVINESLQIGGRPDSTLAVSTENGEDIEVRSVDSKGDLKTKMIRWTVDPAVPDPLLG